MKTILYNTASIVIAAVIILSVFAFIEWRNKKSEQDIANDIALIIKKRYSLKNVTAKIVKDTIQYTVLTPQITPMEMGLDSMDAIAGYSLECTKEFFPGYLKFEHFGVNFLSLDSVERSVIRYRMGFPPKRDSKVYGEIGDVFTARTEKYFDSLTTALKASKPITLTIHRKWYDEQRKRICAINTVTVALPYSMADSSKTSATRISKALCKAVLKDTAYNTLIEFRLYENCSIDEAKTGQLPEATRVYYFPTTSLF